MAGGGVGSLDLAACPEPDDRLAEQGSGPPSAPSFIALGDEADGMCDVDGTCR